MNVQKIIEEIKQLERQIEVLQIQISEIQQSCDHHFIGNEYYETCSKCNKVNVLYY
ncbi:serine protease [Siminovitchia sp. 179-K 8D1 HS]|uniref:serine protease n=1 Tax=Siminovitchia sp. 179-K 8D1 HS TaxID=3142385 RepID=UPI0039A143E9